MALYTWPGRKRLVIQDHADERHRVAASMRCATSAANVGRA
jgi:hypothetical protein